MLVAVDVVFVGVALPLVVDLGDGDQLDGLLLKRQISSQVSRRDRGHRPHTADPKVRAQGKGQGEVIIGTYGSQVKGQR